MPVAIEIGADLLLLCALIVLVGLAKGLDYTFVAFLKWLGGRIRGLHIPLTHIGIPGTGAVGGALENAANWMHNQIGVGVLALEHTAVYFWHALGRLAALLGDQLKGLAYDLLWVYHRVEKFTVPYWIDRLQRWVIRQLVAFAHHPIRYLRHAVADVQHGAVAVARIAVAAPGALARTPPWIGKRIGALEREVTGLENGRFRWLERLALGGLATGVALRLLQRVAPWVRCRNVARVGRRLCASDPGLLDSLLADLLVIAGTISVVEFARECQDVAPPLEDGLHYFLRELHGVGA